MQDDIFLTYFRLYFERDENGKNDWLDIRCVMSEIIKHPV